MTFFGLCPVIIGSESKKTKHRKDEITMNNSEIGKAMTIKLDPVLPEYPVFKEGIRRAPMRELTLSDHEKKLAVKNALRYIPEELHEQLAPEFMEELLTHGRTTDTVYAKRENPRKTNRRIQRKLYSG